MPDATTYRLTSSSGVVRYLKLVTAEHHPPLPHEQERMAWAAPYVPVPAVVEADVEGPVHWLPTEALAGSPATDPRWKDDPGRIVERLARALRHFHERMPVDACPFDFRLDAALQAVRQRVREGAIDPVRDFHEEFSDLTPEAALRRLEAQRPASEDLVVCHGDYCPPNILFTDQHLGGYVDLGELGVADRWWDLSVATWSVGWNFGPAFEGPFLAAYGADMDDERRTYYRLLYDMAS